MNETQPQRHTETSGQGAYMIITTELMRAGAIKRQQIEQARRAVRGSVYTLGRFRKWLALATAQPTPILSTEYRSGLASQARSDRAYYGE